MLVSVGTGRLNGPPQSGNLPFCSVTVSSLQRAEGANKGGFLTRLPYTEFRTFPLGAFDPVRRRLLVHTSPTKRSTDFIALLDQLGGAYDTAERARPLVAVLDNGPIHRSKLTTRALAQRPWLTLEWLPKYAPELNDIERC